MNLNERMKLLSGLKHQASQEIELHRKGLRQATEEQYSLI